MAVLTFSGTQCRHCESYSASQWEPFQCKWEKAQPEGLEERASLEGRPLPARCVPGSVGQCEPARPRLSISRLWLRGSWLCFLLSVAICWPAAPRPLSHALVQWEEWPSLPIKPWTFSISLGHFSTLNLLCDQKDKTVLTSQPHMSWICDPWGLSRRGKRVATQGNPSTMAIKGIDTEKKKNLFV